MEPIVVIIKEEEDDIEIVSMPEVPKPLKGIHDVGPPPFLTKMFEMVEDPNTNVVISWSHARNSFVVWDSVKFSTILLPKYFKHSNFSSFIRQLNTYGFRKVDPDRWEFAHEDFLGGQIHLLKNIKRRRNVGQSLDQQQQNQATDASVELGQFGNETEIKMLRRDKNVLMAEIVKLRQQQQSSREQLIKMEQRIEGNERKQRQTMAFLARALKNPKFMQELLSRTEQQERLGDAGKKRRMPTNMSWENLQATGSKMDEESIEPEIEYLLSSIEDNLGCISVAPANDLLFEPLELSLGAVSDSILQELMNDDFLVGNEMRPPSGGENPEAEVEVEDLAADPFEWGEEMQELAVQMGFLDSKPYNEIYN